MLNLLHEAEAELPLLLDDREGWKSLFIDYHASFVERLYRPWRENRLYLHCIHSCPASAALFHPHPWPSAMRVHTGTYEMGIGYGRELPPVAARIVASGPMEYEMTDRDTWHYVRPIGGVALTVMISGPPWERESPAPSKALSPLAPARVSELLAIYRDLYSTRLRNPGSPS
jgi:hypothetical protein